MEGESRAQTSLDFPRSSGKPYFRCTLNSPSKRLFTIEEMNSSVSEAFEESFKYSPSTMHSRSKTEFVPPLQRNLEALRDEIISHPEELLSYSAASSARTDSKRSSKAPFSNTIARNKLGKSKKSLSLLSSPLLSARTSRPKRGKSPQQNQIAISRTSAGKGKSKNLKK